MSHNPDFRELFSALSAADARFLVVGAYAAMQHTPPRYTKNLDVWVDASPENAVRVYAALRDFGAPISDLTVQDLATPGVTLQIGVEPNRIDILTSIEAVVFAEAWERRLESTYSGVGIHVLGFADLTRNKRAVGRPQDLLDVANLEEVKPPETD